MVFIISQMLSGLILFLAIFEVGVIVAATIIVRQFLFIRLWAGVIICAIFALKSTLGLPPICFAWCVFLISTIGTAFDLLFDIHAICRFGVVDGCLSESASGAISYYGNESPHDLNYCLAGAGTSVVPDRCYCYNSILGGLFSGGGGYCVEHDIFSGMNCGYIVNAYTAIQSLVFVDAAITVSAIMMVIFSFVVDSCPREIVIAETSDAGEAVIDRGLSMPYPSLSTKYSSYSTMSNASK